MKISLPGYDVKTATPEQCAFHSKYASLKVALGKDPVHFGNYTHEFTGPISTEEATILLTVAHGYSYIPAHLCLIEYSSDADQYTQIMPFTIGPSLTILSYCDDTNFVIEAYSASGSDLSGERFTFKYYIFADVGS